LKCYSHVITAIQGTDKTNKTQTMEFSMRNDQFNKTQKAKLTLWLRGMIVMVIAGAMTSQAVPPDRFQQVNLVSDLPGRALLQDTNLVNAWGVAFTPNSPFWISDNGTGKATLYAITNDSEGVHVMKQGLEVTIPGEGNPTGQVFNNVSGFNGDLFLFDSEDGTISGWRPALGTAAEVLTVRTGAVYKGLALATTSNGPVLLAANFSEGTVDVYDTNSTLIAQYSDALAPDGYAPFNVQTLDGMVFVTFAKQDEEKEDDVAGAGNGLIDVFDPNTGEFHRFATGTDAGGDLKEINSPWGLALAPSTFGEHAGQLLVGNFGSGTIMTFDATGDFEGLLRATRGGFVSIEGLWALSFGNGGRGGSPDTLYFTAGPDDESHGLFGELDRVSKQKPHP
jgi:uncharacterized protein (TIGR03118 family)